jgi:hypothetical protein
MKKINNNSNNLVVVVELFVMFSFLLILNIVYYQYNLYI